ncbi:hypothetical protein LBMAG38_10560 [Chloroflexota bacterium]|nr:hypothetical protein LBMAG38_10560 [Chloroflexota bacterium]
MLPGVRLVDNRNYPVDAIADHTHCGLCLEEVEASIGEDDDLALTTRTHRGKSFHRLGGEVPYPGRYRVSPGHPIAT